jgi:DNA-binding transcriptional LysR family regulator
MPIDPRISLFKLQVLSLVVELGGIGKAADQLVVAQPVVSTHIRTLEERLGGAKLFYREGRQLHLTEAGREVYGWAQEVLTRTRELERHLDGLTEGAAGTVSLAASMSVGSYRLPHVLTSFRARYPNAQIRLGILDTEHAIDETRAGIYDFSIVVSDEHDIPGMHAEPIGRDEIVLVTAPGAEPRKGVISLEELTELSFIDPQGIIRRTFVDQQLRRLGVVDRKVVLEMGHPEAMKRAVRDGVGVTLLFRSAVADDLGQGLLREVSIEGADVSVPIYLVYRKGKTFSLLHRRLIEQIRSALRSPDDALDSQVASGVEEHGLARSLEDDVEAIAEPRSTALATGE